MRKETTCEFGVGIGDGSARFARGCCTLELTAVLVPQVQLFVHYTLVHCDAGEVQVRHLPTHECASSCPRGSPLGVIDRHYYQSKPGATASDPSDRLYTACTLPFGSLQTLRRRATCLKVSRDVAKDVTHHVTRLTEFSDVPGIEVVVQDFGGEIGVRFTTCSPSNLRTNPVSPAGRAARLVGALDSLGARVSQHHSSRPTGNPDPQRVCVHFATVPA